MCVYLMGVGHFLWKSEDVWNSVSSFCVGARDQTHVFWVSGRHLYLQSQHNGPLVLLEMDFTSIQRNQLQRKKDFSFWLGIGNLTPDKHGP